MKVINTLVLLFLCSFVSVNAQVSFPRGTKSLGGSVQYYRYTNTTEQNTTSPISTATANTSNTQSNNGLFYGYFLKDNLEFNIGLYGTYSNYTSSTLNVSPNSFYEYSQSNSSYLVSLGLGITKYYFIGQSNFAFMLGGSIRGGIGRNQNEQNNQPNSRNNTTRNVYSGEVYFFPRLLYVISPKWSVTGGLGTINYRYSQTVSLGNDDYKGSDSQLNATLGISSLSLGLTYYIR